jgi:hypothetical protein
MDLGRCQSVPGVASERINGDALGLTLAFKGAAAAVAEAAGLG